LIYVAPFTFNSAQASGVRVTGYISVCGDGVAHGTEVCDGNDLKGQTCQDFGFTQGTLACNLTCDAFDASNCYTPPTSPPGGGGGGGETMRETGANFSGRAYPNRSVTLLKDAQVVATTIAGSNASFYLKVTDLTPGTYIFALYSEDYQGRRSTLVTFPLSITLGTITNVTGIFIAPSVDINKSEVRRGDNIAIFGQSAPQADIVISVSSDEEFFARTVSDKDGIYLHNFDTSILEYGTHYTKSKASIGNLAISGFSHSVNFMVGTRNVDKFLPTKCPDKADLNDDCRVNLVDFSIAAYWYRKSLSSAMKKTECERLNCDEAINLTDFSIMAYYWTG
jgi:hypothetical protein